MFNDWSGDVSLGMSAGGDGQFNIAILTNGDYQPNMTLNSFNIEWN